MAYIDPIIDQSMKADILHETVQKLRGLEYRRMPDIQREYEVAEATVYRKRRELIVEIYDEMSDWDPSVTQEEIAQRYGIEVSDLSLIKAYAEDKFYV